MPKDIQIITRGPKQTQKLGIILAKEILKTKNGPQALIIGLIGNLGGGKTTFVQGLAKGLGIKENIISPTFVLMKAHQLKTRNYKLFIHLDAFRVSAKDFLSLGWKEWISNPNNIIVIEWLEKMRRILPKQYCVITFKFINKDKRQININFNGTRSKFK